MNRIRIIAVAALALVSLGVSGIATAREGGGSRTEVSLQGGLQVLNENDSALPDQFVNIPAVASIAYHFTPILAVEGEFTWMIPVQQEVDLGSGTTQDGKTADILAYQAGVRATWPVSTSWSPYLAAGVGALTVLSNTDADRVPQVAESETMFALNFGAGATYDLNSRWALRGDFREFVAFPSDEASGLSNGGAADELWMERVTVGVAYRF